MDSINKLSRNIQKQLGLGHAGRVAYTSSLLGVNLEELLRICTAKTLEAPDTTANQQVVETINSDIQGGKPTQEIVALLKARLRLDNPHKQWLAVKLMEQVLIDCRAVLDAHHQELLEEVARVMARPSKPDTEPGKRARGAAKELLRQYGPAGNTAYRNVSQQEPLHILRKYGPAGNSADTLQQRWWCDQAMPVTRTRSASAGQGHAPTYMGHGAASGMSEAAIERQSIIEEVALLMEKARCNTELLSDMLVTSSVAPDEFEMQLVSDLTTEVRELREIFTVYLEQLSTLEGEDIDRVLPQALEAVDMLDSAMQLQQDVAANHMAEARAAAAGGSGSSSAPAAPAAAAATTAAPAAGGADLMAFDDLADGLAASSTDPFSAASASTTNPFGDAPPAPAAASDPFAGFGGAAPAAFGSAAPPPQAPAQLYTPLPPAHGAPKLADPFASVDPFSATATPPAPAPIGANLFESPPVAFAPPPAAAAPAAGAIAPGTGETVDTEWEMFFSDRAK